MENQEIIPDEIFRPLSPIEGEAVILHSPTPNDPPWGVLTAIGFWIASVAAIVIFPTFFLLPYLATHKPPVVDPEQLLEFAKNDPTSILLQIVSVIPAHLVTIGLAWLIVTKVNRYEFFKMLGWQRGGFRLWHYILILVGFFALAGVVGHFVPEKENDLLHILRSSRNAVYIVAFIATFTAPIVEEVVYRGVLYSAFQRAVGIPAAFVLVTGLFALVHVPQYWPSVSTIFLLSVLSLTLTAIRVKTNNLLPCVILHTLFNGLQSLFLLLEPLARNAETQQQAPAFFHLIK